MKKWLSEVTFRTIHSRFLVYNTCWEDPRLDREALEIKPNHEVMVITSAGCNALDYLLAGAKRVHAVDLNPRQNAVLELKLAALENLDYEMFFDLFGRGRIPHYRQVYQQRLRKDLPPFARNYWDKYINYFSGEGSRAGFYYHGSSGVFARGINWYIDRVAKVRELMNSLLKARSVGEQEEYFLKLFPELWTPFMRWCLNRDSTLALVGVPLEQRKQVESGYAGGIVKFIEDCLYSVFACLPITDNYFWRVYLTGEYTPTCCPEYLKEENFEELKNIARSRVTTYNNSVTGFLKGYDGEISRYVLLDHMDWLSFSGKQYLAEEWQSIVDRASPDARVIWRSGGLQVDYVDPLIVRLRSESVRVGDLLNYNHSLAKQLHEKDRVHTYGSFYIADLATA